MDVLDFTTRYGLGQLQGLRRLMVKSVCESLPNGSKTNWLWEFYTNALALIRTGTRLTNTNTAINVTSKNTTPKLVHTMIRKSREATLSTTLKAQLDQDIVDIIGELDAKRITTKPILLQVEQQTNGKFLLTFDQLVQVTTIPLDLTLQTFQAGNVVGTHTVSQSTDSVPSGRHLLFDRPQLLNSSTAVLIYTSGGANKILNLVGDKEADSFTVPITGYFEENFLAAPGNPRMLSGIRTARTTYVITYDRLLDQVAVTGSARQFDIHFINGGGSGTGTIRCAPTSLVNNILTLEAVNGSFPSSTVLGFMTYIETSDEVNNLTTGEPAINQTGADQSNLPTSAGDNGILIEGMDGNLYP